MAAILKLRRGSTTPTSLEQSELFYNSTLATIQVGKSSASNDNITLVKLTETNSGNLQIVGTISGSYLTLNNDITASNAYFRGDVRLDGQIILGDVPQDNINVNAQFSGSLIPSASTFDLGSTTKKWNNVYANNLNGSVTDSNLLNFTSSINAFTASEESKNSTLASYTGSNNTKWTTLGTYTGSVDSKFITLGTYTGSIDTKFTTLGTYTSSIDTKFTTLASITGSITASIIELFGTASNHESRIVYLSGSFSQSVDSRLDQLEVNSGSVNNSISLLNTFSSSQEAKDSTLATYTGSIDTKFTTLGTYTSSVDLDLTSIHLFTSSQETKDSTLATYTGSVNNQLTELYSTASNHETRIDGIQDYTASLRTAIGVNGSNVTINGDLSVLGTTTQINSTQVNIGENILELNYGGSATTAGIITKDATGGSTISGSLLWDATNDYWKGGKLGSESKLLLAGGDGVVSGSAQVVDALKTTFLEINGDSVVSGSSQINLTQTTNYISGIKDRLNAETVISGSSQVNLVDSADYVSAIKNRLNIESVISSSIQVDVLSTTNFTTYSSSVDSKLVQLANDSASQDGRLDNLELFSSSQETKDSTLATYTGSIDTKWSTLENVTSSLINATASYETKGRNIVSGSSQLTESYDLRYANSASFHNLVGAWDFGTQGSIRDAAFYNVTSSAQLDTNNPNFTSSLNDSIIFTAGAVKEYVNFRTEAILTAIGAADITAVNAGNGLSGGGVSGDVTLHLNTGSAHFTNGVKTKLNIDGVISGSSQIVSILGPLNTFSSSQELKYSTLASYTGSVNNQLTELYSTASNHEVRIDNLEIFSSSVDTTYEEIASGTHTLISGSSQLSGKVIPNLSGSFTGSYTGSFTGTFTGPLTGLAQYASQVATVTTGTTTDTTLYPMFSTSPAPNTYITPTTHPSGSFYYNGVTRKVYGETFVGAIEATNGVLSGSAQIIDILGPLNTFSASQELKDSTLATYTGSIDTKNNTLGVYTASNDTKWSTLGSLSGSFARIDSANTFNGSQIVSGSLTITQDLVVLGSSSIQNISSSRLDIGDNIIQLNVNQPSVRFGGIAIFDSGSAGGSGSFLYDAVQDEFIFVHKGNGTNITSSHFVLGPETIDDLGNELYLTNNRIPKGTGKEHLNDSNITDTGTLITLGSDVVVTGTLVTTGTPLVSGSSQITLSSTIGGGTSANVQFGSLGIGMAASGTTGRIDATNDIVAYSSSDRRFKENITPIENALDKINQIGGYEFDWKDENKIEHGYEGHDLGVIAQEIEMIAPELVQTRENGYKAVKYDKLVSVLIQAIKELSAKVTELENK